ncbi:hypothetical protein ACIRQY_33660 [Streptomyces sp. NPDC101490]|uniref:hypothetical protein n=1 Tax=Streptomyces sp. NPDC101490 TaxID=3366143 RepID=UPI00380EF2FE
MTDAAKRTVLQTALGIAVVPLTGATPVLTPQQIAAHEEAIAAQQDYEVARDAYWTARTS